VDVESGTVEYTVEVTYTPPSETFTVEVVLLDSNGVELFKGGPVEYTISESEGEPSPLEVPAVYVGPELAKPLSVTGITDPITTGTSSDVTVTARDGFGDVATAYRGTVTFTSSDSSATLPANYTFVSDDAGVHTFTGGVTLFSVGEQSVTATDVAVGAITGSQTSITVLSIPNTPPTVSITAPGDSITLPEGWQVAFRAAASDVEQGDLSVLVVWASDLDGALGSGAGISPALSVGALRVKDSVTDARGQQGADTIRVTILPLGTIPLSATETIFDFDLRSFPTGPPYSNITFRATFDPTDPVTGSDVMITNVYGGPNGTELVQVRNDTDFIIANGGTLYGPLTTANPIFDPMLDGVFSFGVQMTSGTATMTSFTACGDVAFIIVSCVTVAADLLMEITPTADDKGLRAVNASAFAFYVGSDDALMVGFNPLQGDFRSAIEFALPTVPFGHAVESAELTLDLAGASRAGGIDIVLPLVIHGYDADGLITVSDFLVANPIHDPLIYEVDIDCGCGFFGSGFTGPGLEDSNGLFTVDITAFIDELTSAGSSFVGFTLSAIPTPAEAFILSYVSLERNVVGGPPEFATPPTLSIRLGTISPP